MTINPINLNNSDQQSVTIKTENLKALPVCIPKHRTTPEKHSAHTVKQIVTSTKKALNRAKEERESLKFDQKVLFVVFVIAVIAAAVFFWPSFPFMAGMIGLTYLTLSTGLAIKLMLTKRRCALLERRLMLLKPFSNRQVYHNFSKQIEIGLLKEKKLRKVLERISLDAVLRGNITKLAPTVWHQKTVLTEVPNSVTVSRPTRIS